MLLLEKAIERVKEMKTRPPVVVRGSQLFLLPAAEQRNARCHRGVF